MRYLIQNPSIIGSSAPAKIWIALHGATGTAEQGIELFGEAAKRHNALLIACEATRPLGNGFAWSFANDYPAVIKIIEQFYHCQDRRLYGFYEDRYACKIGSSV